MKKYIALASLILSSFGAVQAQSPVAISKHSIKPESLRRLDSLYNYLDTTGLYNGNILVGIGGRKASVATIGYANLDTKEKLTETSIFNLASVSKQFTAAGVLLLVQDGRISLDQEVATILPGFPYRKITVRHLLNHTGGLPEYQDMIDAHWDRTKIASNSDLLKMFIKEHPKLKFEPGTKWEYSNGGYALLASIIETVSKKSFTAYMQENVFTPLGLEHTAVYMPRYAPRYVKGYAYSYVEKEPGKYVQPDSIPELDFVRYLDGIAGQGRVTSTVTDLLTWNNAVRDKKLLSAKLWAEATTPPTIDGKSTDYGFGLEVVNSPERGRVLRHTGSWPAYINNNVLYLDKDVSLIFLTNKEQEAKVYQATFDAVKNIVFEKPFTFPAPLVQTLAVVDTTIYPRYTGIYATPAIEGFELSISARDGKLYALGTGSPEAELLPESETMYFIKGEPIKIEFKKAQNNNLATLILHQNGEHVFSRKN